MKVVLTDMDVPMLPSSDSRAPGVHVSDLYNGLYAELEPDRYGKKDDTGPPELKLALGLAWEQYLEKQLREQGIAIVRPPEQFTKDGIAFNPDGLVEDRGVEYKLTWMADPGEAIAQAKFAKWVTQMKSYGHHLEIGDWDLYALFINGDYRANRNPVLRRYRFSFTSKELKENWHVLRTYAEARRLK